MQSMRNLFVLGAGCHFKCITFESLSLFVAVRIAPTFFSLSKIINVVRRWTNKCISKYICIPSPKPFSHPCPAPKRWQLAFRPVAQDLPVWACSRICKRAHPGFEPGTSRTLSENHTPRPTSLMPKTVFLSFCSNVSEDIDWRVHGA